MEKTPIYQRDTNCIQVGSEATDKIEFSSKDEMAEFLRNFQRVFFDFTGIGFDMAPNGVAALGKGNGTSESPLLPRSSTFPRTALKNFSQAHAVSRFWEFATPLVVAEEKPKANQGCVVLKLNTK